MAAGPRLRTLSAGYRYDASRVATASRLNSSGDCEITRAMNDQTTNSSAQHGLVWRFGAFEWTLGHFPMIMGILNVTPDSFSDGGQHNTTDAAVQHGLQLVEAGADIIDVGGESTRPGAAVVSADDETERVVPVIEKLAAATDVPISIDTTKSQVAAAGIRAGARIVNDISGLTFDSTMPELCAANDVGVVCMHIQGTPQTMQENPHYDDVVAEVSAFLVQRLEVLAAAGIPHERVVVDPGIGFGKTAEHNLTLLSSIAALRATGRPVLIGHSRKRFLSRLIGRPVDERRAGTIGVSVAVAAQGADILRVHDVTATRDALTAWHAISRRSLAN